MDRLWLPLTVTTSRLDPGAGIPNGSLWPCTTSVGTATASKLLARKRPRLCPVSDKVVIGAVGVPGWTWEALRTFLQDPAARAEIEALRPPPAAAVSVLRILDVAIWIRHSHSRAASRIRRDSGIPEPGHGRP